MTFALATRRSARRRAGSIEGKAMIVLLYVSATVLFTYIYAAYSGFKWGYMGLQVYPDPWRLAVAYSGLAVLVAALPTGGTPRAFFLHCFSLLYVMPSAVLFGYNNFPYLGLVCVFVATAIVYLVSRVPFPFTMQRTLGLKSFALGTMGVTALTVLSVVVLSGFGTFNLDLNEVYVLRDEAAEKLPAVFGYIVPTATKTLIPFGIAAALYYRYLSLAVLLVVASIVLFGFTTHKIVLFAPIVVAATYVSIERFSPITVLAAGTTVVLGSTAAAFTLNDYIPGTSFWGWVESMFVWRSLIVPSYLDFEHVRFFSDNAQYFWSNSQVTLGLIDPPHNGITMPRLIGIAAFNLPTLEANTGFIGSGFGQAGFIGVVLYAFGVGLFLSLTETAARTLGAPFVISASLTLVLTMFMSTDFIGMFLTHGLLLAIALLLLLKPALATTSTAAPTEFKT